MRLLAPLVFGLALSALSCRAEPLPDLGVVPHFSLTSERGAPFGDDALTGTPTLVAFFFTRCPTVCPRLVRVMKEVGARAKAEGHQLRLVVISVDPEHDTPEVLQAYAAKHGLTSSDFHLLTGEYQTIATTAEDGFRIGLSGRADTTKDDLGITHGSHLVLVDEQRRIRGYYRSFDEDVVSQVVKALERLGAPRQK